MARTREDVLRIASGLMAKAMDPATGPEERDSFKIKADTMIAEWAIEEFELGQADQTKRVKPELREMRYPMTSDEDVNEAITQMFYAVAMHCGCKLGLYGWKYSKVVGFPTDLDYLEMMFLSIQMQMVMEINPTWDPAREEGENLHLMKGVGMKWEDIHYLQNPGQPWERRIGVRYTNVYKAWAEKHGIERMNSNPKTYRVTFIEAYSRKIRWRLTEMQKARDEATSGKGLVLADRNSDLLEALYEFFPNLRPHPDTCKCASCRPAASTGRSVARYKAPAQRRIDERAWSAGMAAAERADLSGGAKLADKKEALGGGSRS